MNFLIWKSPSECVLLRNTLVRGWFFFPGLVLRTSGDLLESEAVAGLIGRLFLFSSSASVFRASLSLLQFICPTGAGRAAKAKWDVWTEESLPAVVVGLSG